MINKEIAIKNVVELQKILPKSFAIYGTALGSLREGDVIGHDPDTDIGMMIEDFNYADVNIIIRQGFDLIRIFGSSHFGLEISFRKDGVKTDIMFFYKDGNNKRFNCLWDKNIPIVHEYPNNSFDVIEGKLGNENIRTLGEKYIKLVYGSNWRVPVKEWNWRTDHKCIKI